MSSHAAHNFSHGEDIISSFPPFPSNDNCSKLLWKKLSWLCADASVIKMENDVDILDTECTVCTNRFDFITYKMQLIRNIRFVRTNP